MLKSCSISLSIVAAVSILGFPRSSLAGVRVMVTSSVLPFFDLDGESSAWVFDDESSASICLFDEVSDNVSDNVSDDVSAWVSLFDEVSDDVSDEVSAWVSLLDEVSDNVSDDVSDEVSAWVSLFDEVSDDVSDEVSAWVRLFDEVSDKVSAWVRLLDDEDLAWVRLFDDEGFRLPCPMDLVLVVLILKTPFLSTPGNGFFTLYNSARPSVTYLAPVSPKLSSAVLIIREDSFELSINGLK